MLKASSFNGITTNRHNFQRRTLVKGTLTRKKCVKWGVSLEGQCHEIFDPRFFSSNNPPQGPDLRPKAILHMASYSPRKSDDIRIDTAETISVVLMTPLKSQ
jgi:hypothetical protein